jgi:hypothetical protein
MAQWERRNQIWISAPCRHQGRVFCSALNSTSHVCGQKLRSILVDQAPPEDGRLPFRERISLPGLASPISRGAGLSSMEWAPLLHVGPGNPNRVHRGGGLDRILARPMLDDKSAEARFLPSGPMTHICCGKNRERHLATAPRSAPTEGNCERCEIPDRVDSRMLSLNTLTCGKH